MQRLFICVACVLLGGCADYMNHRDTITFGAGNAMEANKGIHIRDPLNPQSENTTIYADGRHVAAVMSDYYGTPIARVPTPYQGNCETPEDVAADGSRCGNRAASVRPGGQ